MIFSVLMLCAQVNMMLVMLLTSTKIMFVMFANSTKTMHACVYSTVNLSNLCFIHFESILPDRRYICIGNHMRGEVISVLSLEG